MELKGGALFATGTHDLSVDARAKAIFAGADPSDHGLSTAQHARARIPLVIVRMRGNKKLGTDFFSIWAKALRIYSRLRTILP